MEKVNLRFITMMLCLLVSTLLFPKTTLAASIPSAPTDFSATAESSSEIYLDWDSVNNATSYQVYRSTSSSGTYSKIATTTSTQYTNTNLSSDTTYYYKILALNSAGESPYSSKKYATTDESDDSDESDSLSAPEDLNVTAEGPDEIYLDWDSVSDATSYQVYRSTSSSGTYSKIATTTSSKYTNTNLSSDTTYYYKVLAVNSTGKSDYSSKEYATTDESDESDDSDESDSLSAPEDLTATAEGPNEIYLDWDSVSDATSYQVYRSTSSSGTYSKIATTTSSKYTNTNLSPDTTYYYKVLAVDSTGKSDYSSKEHATTDESDDLSAPNDLSATVESSSEIYLKWDSVSDAKSYYVYRSTDSSGTYSKIATTTSSNYTNTSLSADTTYYYKVRAVNSSGDTSDYSSRADAKTSKSGTTTPPSDPTSEIKSERLAGNDMYATSVEVSKAGWNTSYYAIIVSGEVFSDALCSAPLAQKYNSPLLLTTKASLNAQTKLELSRLKTKNVIIIGGTGVVSSAVEQSIKDMGIEVSRIAGKDLYETSIKIAEAMGDSDQAVVACGVSFPDALSIAPIATMKGMPIILTPKDTLPENIKNYLLKNVQSTYVVGGTGVISENVFKQLPSPKRLSGINRYETNVSIIKEFANELDFSTCYISTGEYFTDALSGSALASLTNSPVILVSDPVDQSTINFFRSKASSIEKEVVFGGTVIVPESILTSLHGSSNGSDAPSTPTNITATTASASQINLTWDSVSGATSYYVYGATSSSGTYTHLATVTTTGYINTGLWADTTYYYKVQAVNNTGSSPYSDVYSAKTDN
ncbi:cell wall-binding protein [Desulfosporosinus fructosivorans]|uniref:Cell wall-binding protein n=1 Tax=Desulfosporosinus fructosivorans TaxID=2018669 RepID=A0A4Z0R8Z3_9FIRM|nr:cell wall-binding repeat-containing protein [Desulfosporosinus fructosivorans]TGE39651.1 cell wall-binding protein [Desulfosporosinus fructosivorans]